MAMNLNTYNRLPDKVKNTIEEMREEGIRQTVEVCAKLNHMLEGKMKEVGIEFIQPPEADVAKVSEYAEQILDKWVKDMEAKGLPAQKVVSEYKTLITEYQPLPVWSK